MALEQPIRSLTRPELFALLERHGASASLIENVREELQNCDLARFASSEFSLDEMRNALRRVISLTHEVDDISA